jgi:hypothetical protein
MKAFPQSEATMHIDLPIETQQGMDLRDYFAAQALQGLTEGNLHPSAIKAIALIAYQIADAMMEARK